MNVTELHRLLEEYLVLYDLIVDKYKWSNPKSDLVVGRIREDQDSILDVLGIRRQYDTVRRDCTVVVIRACVNILKNCLVD